MKHLMFIAASLALVGVILIATKDETPYPYDHKKYKGEYKKLNNAKS